jgi:hypothetical protein
MNAPKLYAVVVDYLRHVDRYRTATTSEARERNARWARQTWKSMTSGAQRQAEAALAALKQEPRS